MRVLVSGASIAGPVTAYWLAKYGFEVTVVERAERLRKAGGHAVDLFRPAVEISERMGVLDRVEAKATGTDRMVAHVPNRARPVEVDLRKIYGALSDRHVEVMRDDLSEIYHDATAADVEYVFGDTVTAIAENGEVAFARSGPRHFDLIIGADGLHSTIRRLVFGPEHLYSHHIGAHLAVLSLPAAFATPGEFTGHFHPNRIAGLYGDRHGGDSRAVFLFRSPPLDYHHRDIPRQITLLRQAFAAIHPDIDTWLSTLDGDHPFYFDSITQLRMNTWSKGRVTLVGDAAHCPGPAVGGSTSLAIYGAYTLAGELAAANGNPAHAYPSYERALAKPVIDSRVFALNAAKTLIPTTRLGIHTLVQGSRLVAALPAPVARLLTRLANTGARLHDTFEVRDYAPLGGT